MGVNVLSAWAIERFVEGSTHLDLPDLLRAIRTASATVRVRRTDAYWLDIGRMADLEAAVEVFATRSVALSAMIGGRVLVTGSSGLIGRAVFARLNALGVDVTGRLPTQSSPGMIRADLTDARMLRQL